MAWKAVGRGGGVNLLRTPQQNARNKQEQQEQQNNRMVLRKVTEPAIRYGMNRNGTEVERRTAWEHEQQVQQRDRPKVLSGG